MRRLTHRYPARLLAAAAAVVVGLSARAALAASAPAAPSPALRIDYLPNLIYDGERLTVCGRLVNPSRVPVSGRVTCTLSVGRRALGEPVVRAVRSPGDGEQDRFEAAWVLEELLETATLTVELTVDGVAAGRARAAVYPASLDMPELRLAGDRMVDGSGDRAVLVVRRQLPERASRWAVVKLVEEAVTGGKVQPTCALFVGDLLAADEAESYARLLRTAPEMSCFSFLTVRHPRDAERATYPVFRTLCAFSRAALKRRYDLVVLFVGSREARLGTDVDEFRKAIDLMAGLAKSSGSKHIVFVTPVAPPKLLGRTARYRRVVRSVAHAAGAQVFDLQPAVARAGWGRSAAPGPDARRALADEVVKMVEAVTRR
jgi:hypothetical protein